MKFLFLAALAAFPLFACSPAPTASTSSAPAAPDAPTESASRTYGMKDFNSIKDGMTQAQIEKLLGKGKTVSTSSGGGMEMVVLQWQNADFTNITVTLINGKLSSKAQFGLK